MTELTLNQQLAIRSFELQVNKMTDAEIKELLMNTYRNFLIQETYYKQLLKKQLETSNEKHNRRN
jgi:hypothetical protein